ncbi:DUF1761 domain-containing protein [Amnibacterium flavum]|uniref:DUF1761 domain-containing protein n=1 Tax=Amnibacterium flavum TaxID=2173173 RepID=A0A2V1HUE2_9MICO|nr:DUF1761 domain-containing protein [Amnibacterium flavum]PVZ94580.1 DUF1761 domain-containing protein [Amnibacterium flavum]
MVPEINYLAVIAATLSTMIVGSIWYTPKVFGTLWMRLAKVPPVTGTRAAIAPIIATLIVSFVTAWVLAGSVYISQQFYGGSFLGNAMITGLVLFAGFTAARFITHDAFERRPAPLTVLNITHELVTIVIMAFIIGIWPPA